MAHEIDFTKGFAGVFSVKQTPWHRLGKVLPVAPSFEEALTYSGTDFTVGLKQVEFAGEQGFQPVDGYFAVVRQDTGAALAVVSDEYVPLQNVEAFEVLKPLVDRGVATIETGGSLRGGRDTWLLVRFNFDDPVINEVFNAEVVPYAAVTNNHSAQRRATLLETPIRIVCANTLGAALRGQSRRISVTHRGDARVRLIDAANELWGSLIERYRLIAGDYAALKSRILTVEEFTRSVLNIAVPLPEEISGVNNNKRAVWNAEARRGAISRLWERGAGHQGDHSAWEAYNGLVQAIDHDEDLFPTRVSRVEALLNNGLTEKKQAVLEELVAVARKG